VKEPHTPVVGTIKRGSDKRGTRMGKRAAGDDWGYMAPSKDQRSCDPQRSAASRRRPTEDINEIIAGKRFSSLSLSNARLKSLAPLFEADAKALRPTLSNLTKFW
jgi:hypothetical protein